MQSKCSSKMLASENLPVVVLGGSAPLLHRRVAVCLFQLALHLCMGIPFPLAYSKIQSLKLFPVLSHISPIFIFLSKGTTISIQTHCSYLQATCHSIIVPFPCSLYSKTQGSCLYTWYLPSLFPLSLNSLPSDFYTCQCSTRNLPISLLTNIWAPVVSPPLF